MTKISVLLSLFSKEKPLFLDRSIQSIWNDQERKPDEIVLVEDGSVTNELEEVVKKWQSIVSAMKVVKLEKNQGLAIALNEGIKHCIGDYIARMDTDDISLPNRFLLQENYLDTHPEVILVGGGIIEFNDEEGELNPRMMPATTKDVRDTISKSAPFCHPAVMFRRKLFDEGFYYNPECRRAQDWELWFRVIAAGYEVANLPKVIIKFRKDPYLYQKRKKSSWLEFKVSMKGTYRVFGIFSWRYVFPIIHYVFRQLPPSLSQKIYNKFILRYWQKKNYAE